MPSHGDNSTERQQRFLSNLADFAKQHKASHWSGTLSTFLDTILRANPAGVVRSSHQYIWDMVRWVGLEGDDGKFRCKLFEDLCE